MIVLWIAPDTTISNSINTGVRHDGGDNAAVIIVRVPGLRRCHTQHGCFCRIHNTMLELNATEDVVTMLAGFASWLFHTVAQFFDPIGMQVLSTVKSCLSGLSLVCHSDPPPSLQALGEILLNKTNENVVFVIASAWRTAMNSSGLVIGVHGVRIKKS
jgi:hypothetical protein